MFKRLQLIVGLGNPGLEYEKTRHNAGAWFLSRLAEHYQTTFKVNLKFNASIAQLALPDASDFCWLLRPTTYMNDSGRVVARFVNFYKIPPDALLVAHDELDFSVGDIRLKLGGGHGGHNGLRDIIRHLKANDFLRLRIGIGHPGSKEQVTPYVLSPPSRSDYFSIMQAAEMGQEIVPGLMTGGGPQKAMRLLQERLQGHPH